jgi:hypothetical protein
MIETRRSATAIGGAMLVLLVSSTSAFAQDQSSAPSSAPSGVCPARADESAGTSAAVASPATSGAVEGTYRFAWDDVDVSFAIPDGWGIVIEAPNVLQLGSPTGDIYLNVTTMDAPIDPEDPNGRAPVEIEHCAAGFIAWLAEHPYLDGTEPVPTSVAGYAGEQIDVAYNPPAGHPGGCGEGCLIVARVVPEPAEFDRLAMDNLEMDRFVALDVDGDVLIFNTWVANANPATGGDEARFEAGLDAVQEILDSVTANG